MGVSVLTVEGGRVAGITSFLDPALAARIWAARDAWEVVE